jgi:hypothetical protein
LRCSTYKTIFSLDDSLASIKTADDLRSYLKLVSARSRLLQPLSSNYFADAEGEIKVFEGTRAFSAPSNLNVAGLSARVDLLEWTMTAWIQLDSEGGTNVIRKPLGASQPARELSCWGWYIGWPYDRFDYGAHDFRGGKTEPAVFESVVSNASSAADGQVHHVAVVVTSTSLEFWVDGAKSFESQLARPVTDCSGQVLEVGGNAPLLGEITFYPRRLREVDLKEVLFAGFTLEAIAQVPPPDGPPCPPPRWLCVRARRSGARHLGQQPARGSARQHTTCG